MDRKLITTFVVVLAIVAGIGVAVLATAWTNPAGSPPSGGGSLSGLIGYFATAACPGGWSEVTAARGRYIVGLPSGGSVSSTAGTALSNLENRATGAHTHTTGVYTSINEGSTPRPFYSGDGGGTGTNTGSAGSVAGTNAPYIQFIVCQKN